MLLFEPGPVLEADEPLPDELRGRAIRIVEKSGYDAAKTPLDLPISREIIATVERAHDGQRAVLLPTLGGTVPMSAFTDVLGGITNPSLFTTLDIALATGTRTRAAVAYYVLSSTDAQQQAIDNYYQVFLGRGPSPQEDQALVNLIVSGQETPGLAAASVLGTPEYLARVLTMACMS